MGDGTRLTVGDRVHLGSITKPMTATVIATLVEDGLLGWDTSPFDLFPEFAADAHPRLRGTRLDRLLAHRAGIPPFTAHEEMEPVPPFAGSPRDRRLAFAGWLLRQEPVAEPVTEYAYSNAGYTIAAAMAEHAADRSWEELAQARLFDRVPMPSAGWGWPALQSTEQPWGHLKNGRTFEPQDPNGPYLFGDLLAPAGDAHSSVLDLAQFGRATLRGLAGEAALLQAETMRKLATPFGGGDYGLGWVIGESGPYHSGSATTFLAFLVVRPDQDRVYAFVTNAAASETMEPDPADAALIKGLLNTLVERFG